MRCWLCVGLATGCGRWGFSDRRSDATGDPPGDTIAIDAGICHSGTWSAPQLVGVETASEEQSPSISEDELTLYFRSNRNGGTMRALWYATRGARTELFGNPTLITELDSAADDGDPQISADNRTLYYSSQRSGMSEVYWATRADVASPWVDQGAITIMNDPSTQRLAPAVSPDELTLYFAPNLNLGVASRQTRAGTFTFDRELTELNSNPTDGNPSITADGLEIFFDSFRTGPAVIYVATRGSTSEVFSAPTPLPELGALGTSAGSPSISADGRTLYFYVSTGQLDLYSATRDCL